jgi:hypothetical protein
MMQITIDRTSEKQARRLVGQELAFIREFIRQGKRLSIAAGKLVYFEPRILFKTPKRSGNMLAL